MGWPETTGGIPVYTVSILLLLKSSLSGVSLYIAGRTKQRPLPSENVSVLSHDVKPLPLVTAVCVWDSLSIISEVYYIDVMCS